MRTGEAMFTRTLGPLFADYASSGVVQTAVNKHLNPQLTRLGIRKLSRNSQAATAGANVTAKHSFDGNSVQSWIADVRRGLVDHAPNLVADWGLCSCRSRFLRGVANTLRHLNRLDDYRQFVRTVPVLVDFALGMEAAMKMKPTEADYAAVERHLPRYVAGKLTLWEGSNTWYDNHCFNVLPKMMRQWGSLRLVSQEGMEAWQKKLNEILRLNNGFANAGAIPKDVHDLGQEAVDAYLEARRKDKPSDARWLYEQALLRTHAAWQPTVAAQDALRGGNWDGVPTELSWARYATLWQRYMACAFVHVCSLARVRVREEDRTGGGYYKALLASVRDYYAPVEVTSSNLSIARRKIQVSIALVCCLSRLCLSVYRACVLPCTGTQGSAHAVCRAALAPTWQRHTCRARRDAARGLREVGQALRGNTRERDGVRGGR